MRKLNINVETEFSVGVPDSMSEEEILEFASTYRADVLIKSRENKARTNVVYELIDELDF